MKIVQLIWDVDGKSGCFIPGVTRIEAESGCITLHFRDKESATFTTAAKVIVR